VTITAHFVQIGNGYGVWGIDAGGDMMPLGLPRLRCSVPDAVDGAIYAMVLIDNLDAQRRAYLVPWAALPADFGRWDDWLDELRDPAALPGVVVVREWRWERVE